MNPYTIGILVSLAVYLAVGTYVGRKVKRLDDYFVAGRQAPTLLIVGTLVASLLSTTAFLGEVGMAYSGYGALILALVAINVTGYIAGALFFGRHLRRSRALTVPEYFGQRFASRRVQSVAGIMIVVGLGAYLMAVTQGTALVVTEVSNVPYRLSLFVVWAAYTAFTFYSGSRGVVINDTMMFLLFTVAAFVAMGCVVAAVGGWYPAVEALATFRDKPGIISWHGFTGPGANWETPADALTWSCNSRARLVRRRGCQSLAGKPLPDGEERARRDPVRLRSGSRPPRALSGADVLRGGDQSRRSADRAGGGCNDLGRAAPDADAGGRDRDSGYRSRGTFICDHVPFAGRVQREP